MIECSRLFGVLVCCTVLVPQDVHAFVGRHSEEIGRDALAIDLIFRRPDWDGSIGGMEKDSCQTICLPQVGPIGGKCKTSCTAPRAPAIAAPRRQNPVSRPPPERGFVYQHPIVPPPSPSAVIGNVPPPPRSTLSAGEPASSHTSAAPP